ncbi:3'(2'),5'-bisphosphate nucleotidase CysQ [Flavobacteriaceae bacterium TK19130]|nr:3'(2'),5'-bisphosphate nucleotidase CysQ [Thermobacterium salinum]
MKYLNLAIEAALNGGAEILKVYSSDDFGVEQKKDDSPLTVADKRANDAIMEFLRTTEIPIISEENKEIAYGTRKEWTNCWIVDPLDGTKEFIKRNGEFTVNIALVENGAPIMGVIYVPVSKELYFADVSASIAKKATVSNEDETVSAIVSQAISIHPKKDSEKARIVGSRSHLNEATENFIESIKEKETVEIVSKGSSLKFCLVAEGKADMYPRYAPTMEWDTAAGQAICEAVGVSVTALPDSEPLRYNKENLLNPHFLVTNRT